MCFRGAGVYKQDVKGQMFHFIYTDQPITADVNDTGVWEGVIHYVAKSIWLFNHGLNFSGSLSTSLSICKV